MILRLRYIGHTPTTFVDKGYELLPGDEFDVPDDESAGYTVRIDIEEVTDSLADEPVAKSRRRNSSASVDGDTSADTNSADGQETAADAPAI
jgi:hypothetical protein